MITTRPVSGSGVGDGLLVTGFGVADSSGELTGARDGAVAVDDSPEQAASTVTIAADATRIVREPQSTVRRTSRSPPRADPTLRSQTFPSGRVAAILGEVTLAPLKPLDPESYGPYRLQGRLGSGGMGVVYLAFGPDGAPVAVKVLQPFLAEDPAYRVRFVREVNAARLVSSPFVARVVDADTESATLWMATDYVEGSTLADAVEANGPIPADRLRGFAADLASAVAALHSVGLIHRDLKPANVVLAWSGPKLIDFGIAKHEGMTDLTQTGVTVGSLMWMSPEMLNGHTATRASDVFAWGLCVAAAGTGRPPFGAGNPQAVAYRIGNAEPDLDGLPPDLAALVARALAKDPRARPTLEDLRASLGGPARLGTAAAVPRPGGGWAATDQGTPAISQSRSSPPPPPPQGQRRRFLIPLLVLGALVVVAGGAAAAILATSGGSSKPGAPPTPIASRSVTSSPTPPPSSSPPPTTSPPFTPANAAAALDTLLSDSALSRANVVAAVNSAASCADPAGAAATLRQAAAGRAEELQRLQLIDLSSIDPSHALVDALTDALTSSRAADLSFAAWATNAVGCSGNAPQDTDFASANQSSMQATAAKQSFIGLWNPIAQRYSLGLRQESDI
jgi:serine/threonine protein kinase